jgi:ribosomal protein L19
MPDRGILAERVELDALAFNAALVECGDHNNHGAAMATKSARRVEPLKVGDTIAMGKFEGRIIESRQMQRSRRWQYLVRWHNRVGVERTWTWHSDITAVQSIEPPFMWRFIK